MITDNNSLHFARAVNKNTDLAIYRRRQSTEGSSEISADNIIRSDQFIGQPLKITLLLCFKSANIAGDSCNIRLLSDLFL